MWNIRKIYISSKKFLIFPSSQKVTFAFSLIPKNYCFYSTENVIQKSENNLLSLTKIYTKKSRPTLLHDKWWLSQNLLKLVTQKYKLYKYISFGG